MNAQLTSDRAEVLRIGEPPELLALVPHALGFQPESSVVFISVRPPRGRVGLVARVDLDDLIGSSGAELADQMTGHLIEDGAAAVAVVIYPGGEQGTREVSEAMGVLADSDLLAMLLDAWMVTEDRYICLTCDHEECCPREGRPLSELDSTSVAASFVMAGSAPARDRAGLATGEEPDPRARATFARALRAERERIATGMVAREQRVVRAVEVLLGTRAATRPALARLAAVLSEKLLRDAVIAWLLEPDEQTLDRERLDQVFARAYSGQAPMPDRTRIDVALGVLTRAARLASGQERAEVLGVRAWLCWWLGDGAGAGVNASEAIELDRAHRLSGLVLRALRGGVGPGWAR